MYLMRLKGGIKNQMEQENQKKSSLKSLELTSEEQRALIQENSDLKMERIVKQEEVFRATTILELQTMRQDLQRLLAGVNQLGGILSEMQAAPKEEPAKKELPKFKVEDDDDDDSPRKYDEEEESEDEDDDEEDEDYERPMKGRKAK